MRRVAALLGAALLASLAGPALPALAHPLGNFTISRFARLDVRPDAIRITYAVDMAEIPTFQERERIDLNGDDELTPDEGDAYALESAGEITDFLELTADGRPLEIRVLNAIGGLGEGQGGLAVLRLDIEYQADLPPGARRIEFADRNQPRRRGWREVIAFGSCGASLAESNVPEHSLSSGLLLYPEGRIDDPPDVREASLTIGAPTGEACPDGPSPSAGPAPSPRPPEGFAGLVARDLSVTFVITAIGLAMGFGALHALGPGHGKTVTAAYLAGSSARTRHAVRAGVAVAAMHTASVLALGLIAAAASAAFPAETVYPWLSLVTGAVVVALGAWLLRSWLRARGEDDHAGHDHAGHDHPHVDPRGPTHEHPHAEPLGRSRLAALAVAGGLLPSPTAVVVLSGAIALGRVAFGLVLVAAFSVGLAAALALVGAAAVRVRTFADGRLGSRVAAWVPVVSAVAVLGAGVYLTVRAILSF